MNRRLVFGGLVALVAFASQSAEAQRRSGRIMPPAETVPAPSVSPYAGYMMFGDIAKGPLGTSLTTSSGSVYGIQAQLPLGSTLSVIGNVGYSQPTLRFGLPVLGGIDFGKSDVWMYDAGLQLNAPTLPGARTISPFVQLGAGGMSYNVQVAGLSSKATNLAVNAGVGIDMPIAQNIGLRLMAKDYIGKFDVNEATGVDYNAKTSNNIALSAGLKLSF